MEETKERRSRALNGIKRFTIFVSITFYYYYFMLISIVYLAIKDIYFEQPEYAIHSRAFSIRIPGEWADTVIDILYSIQ